MNESKHKVPPGSVESLAEAFREIRTKEKEGNVSSKILLCGIWKTPEVDFLKDHLLELQAYWSPDGMQRGEIAVLSHVKATLRKDIPFGWVEWERGGAKLQEMEREIVKFSVRMTPPLFAMMKVLKTWGTFTELVANLIPVAPAEETVDGETRIVPKVVDAFCAVIATKPASIDSMAQSISHVLAVCGKSGYRYILPYPQGLVPWIKFLINHQMEIVRDIHQ